MSGCPGSASAERGRALPSLATPGGSPAGRGPDLRFWRECSVLEMPTAASGNSGRETGRASGPCPERETRRRYDSPAARAHACRIREETCVAWSLGWVSMARTRGPKLRRKPGSAVSSLAAVGDAERGPRLSTGKNPIIPF